METNSTNHIIKLVDRKSIIINGIKKIINFDDKVFQLESVMGEIIVKGNSLEMIKLDTIDGNVSIKGNIDSINYLDTSKSNESLINKLFK
jgi:sporulation protein YabP